MVSTKGQFGRLSAKGPYSKPAAFIETDLVDPRYFSAANVKNRLESYFQMVKAKRVAALGAH